MLEKVFYTSVLVSDQDRALDFYTNVLGLEKRVENPTPDGPRFLTVGVKGDEFQLVLWPGTQGHAEPATDSALSRMIVGCTAGSDGAVAQPQARHRASSQRRQPGGFRPAATAVAVAVPAVKNLSSIPLPFLMI